MTKKPKRTSTEYALSPEQEKAIRACVRTSIMPLIEQVLVKKISQALAFVQEEMEVRNDHT